MMAGCKTSRKQITHVVLDTDVFYEILIRLSLKDVVRCKAVSKEWLSNISNPQFWSRRMAMALRSTSGLLCPFRRGGGGNTAFIDFDKKEKAAASYMTKSILGFIRFSNLGVPHLVILQSCNGLLLCSMDTSEREFEIYVCNPTTQRSRCIPLPPGQQHLKDTVYPHHSPLLWSLAFDPRASHHYKVICLSRKSEIQIYSSESGSWTAPALFNSPNHPQIWVDAHWMGDWKRSVFWNGSLHWIPHKYMAYYYHVDQKRLSMMPTLPLPPNLKEQVQGRWSYFGQSGGEHLHLIWFAAHPFVFTVYEMERDYSTWSLRFCVDLAPVSIACIGKLAPIHILCVVEVQEGCCLLLHLPHKIIRYHLETQTTFELLNCPVADFAYHAFPFMESLAAV